MLRLAVNRLTIICCLRLPFLWSPITAFPVEIVYYVNDHTDAPIWDATTRSLYFVSRSTNMVFRYIPETSELYSTSVDGDLPFSFILPYNPGVFLLGAGKTVLLFAWNGTADTLIKPDDKITLDSFTVSGKLDHKDQLWFSVDTGELCSYWNDTVIKQADDNKRPTGIAWNLYGSKMYVTDAERSLLVRYDVTFNSGIIGTLPNSSTLFDFKAHGFTGDPNGIALDETGHAWVALFNSSQIVSIDIKSCKNQTTIELPAIVTSVAFGDTDLDSLYVTTKRDGTSKGAGCLCRIYNLDSKGIPNNPNQ